MSVLTQLEIKRRAIANALDAGRFYLNVELSYVVWCLNHGNKRKVKS